MHLLTQINRCNAFLRYFILHFSLHSQPLVQFLDEVSSLREVLFSFFLKGQVSKSFSRMLRPDKTENRKVYCAQMHSSSVWVQELKPKSHGWLYIMTIRGLSSSDKDKPLHYAAERIFLRGQFETQCRCFLCGVYMCCLCLCGFPAGDPVCSHSPDTRRWTQNSSFSVGVWGCFSGFCSMNLISWWP